MTQVVIDAGHGGDVDKGGSSWNNAVGRRGTLEKNLTLSIALMVEKLLANRGVTCELTRRTDENLGLASRAKLARENRADCFVSIHFNGSNRHNAQGTETIVHNNYSKRSADFSLAIQDAVLAATGLRDRNKDFDPSRIKTQPLGVLKPARHHADTAACSLQVSFIDLPKEESRLRKTEYKVAIAKAITKGIRAYLAQLDPDSDDLEFDDPIDQKAFIGKREIESYLDLLPPKDSGTPSLDSGDPSDLPKTLFSPDFVNGGFNDNFLADPSAAEDDYLSDFVKFFETLGLDHFAADEFLILGDSHYNSKKCGGKNALPPRELWPNIVLTARVIDQIRAQMGAPIRILSAYRTKSYNTCIIGSKGSFHTEFKALDFTCKKGTPEIWARIARTIMQNDKSLAGGVGVFSSVVHIDCRGTLTPFNG